MQNFIIVGKIIKDTEYRITEKGTAMVRITVAIKSDRKDEKGQYKSDFFNLTAWGKTAEFIQTHFKNGMPISAQAKLENYSYEKNGVKVYGNNFIISRVDFVPEQREPVQEVPFQ